MKTVYLDHHELEALMGALTKRGVEVIPQRLVPGDILVNDILIERKTLSDFATSLKQQRLFEQLDRLQTIASDNGLHPLLIIEAPIDSFTPRMYLIITKIILDLTLPVLFSHSAENTADIIMCLNQRKATTPQPTHFYHPRIWPIKEVRVRMLMHIPSVGRRTAQQLLSKRGTLKNIATAAPEELRAAGLGKKRATFLCKLFTEE